MCILKNKPWTIKKRKNNLKLTSVETLQLHVLFMLTFFQSIRCSKFNEVPLFLFYSWISRLVPSRYLCAGSHGKVRRGNSDWQISFGRDAQIVIEAYRSFFFFKVTALFWYCFVCSIFFVTFIYLFLTIKKLAKSTFYPSSRVLVVSAWHVPGKLRISEKAWRSR